MVIFDRQSTRLSNLEEEVQKEDFWNNPQEAQKILSELSKLKKLVEKGRRVSELLESLKEFSDLLGEDETLEEELRLELENAKKLLEELELQTLFTDEYDSYNAVVTIHAGAGGVDAQDWAEMLLRMYTRWAERNGFKLEIVETSFGEEAGIKSVTFIVKGDFAYGLLKAERGVHRLVRISPFDAAHRRHTSFALVDVIPDIGNEVEIEIKPEDLKIDTFRASGPGGQYVNKTESAVRITHIPTGIVVECQSERSQHQNRETAMRILKARLFALEKEKREKELQAIKGERKDIAWGNQIRSYVLHPYTLVKDHRTGVEIGNIQAVLDGDIDIFISSYLKNTVLKING
ncbi:peptide chain release factor 2 [bacterium]|nr:peptide chain release factor 2 [bacterium]